MTRGHQLTNPKRSSTMCGLMAGKSLVLISHSVQSDRNPKGRKRREFVAGRQRGTKRDKLSQEQMFPVMEFQHSPHQEEEDGDVSKVAGNEFENPESSISIQTGDPHRVWPFFTRATPGRGSSTT